MENTQEVIKDSLKPNEPASQTAQPDQSDPDHDPVKNWEEYDRQWHDCYSWKPRESLT